MKLKALSHYDGDKETRFGDCILIYDISTLIVYDCGHVEHAKYVEEFLQHSPMISNIHIVVSHNDGDHVNGILYLLEALHKNRRYRVEVCSPLYLKYARKVLDILDDGRRSLLATKQNILDTFDKIKSVVEKAQEYGFAVSDATVDTMVASCCIVGPTEEECVSVVGRAIEDCVVTQIEGETVMNAASVQMKCSLENGEDILLCGDASPEYMHNLESYNIIQLPHHGKLDSAMVIFEKLKDPYSKTFLISDNTGSGITSGGSDELVQYMKNERYTPALNTKSGVISIPDSKFRNVSVGKSEGVKLGEMDCKYQHRDLCW